MFLVDKKTVRCGEVVAVVVAGGVAGAVAAWVGAATAGCVVCGTVGRVLEVVASGG